MYLAINKENMQAIKYLLSKGASLDKKTRNVSWTLIAREFYYGI